MTAHNGRDEVSERDLCPHFGECGGCQSQDQPYEAQLAAKESALRALFARWWSEAIPVEPSPVLWHYRNKVDPVFGLKYYDQPPPKDFVRETVLGFKRKGKWFRPLDVRECRIGPEGLDDLFGSMREWMREQGLRAFNARDRGGFLRALLVREGKRTGERMVVLVTYDGDFDRASFIEAVTQVYPGASVHRAVFRGLADVAAADEIESLDGTPTIREELLVPGPDGPRRLGFRLSPFSFFQTNTLGAERLYTVIRDWVGRVAPTVLYDLYGGSGAIALVCADLVRHVHSVENVVEASQDGTHNAARNTVENVTFHTAKVEDYLRAVVEQPGALEPGSAVVVDPPRAGLHPKALRRLCELGPEHLLYVSCKPSVLATELETLQERYAVESLRAVDMFPHTPHVELVAELRRR